MRLLWIGCRERPRDVISGGGAVAADDYSILDAFAERGLGASITVVTSKLLGIAGARESDGDPIIKAEDADRAGLRSRGREGGSTVKFKISRSVKISSRRRRAPDGKRPPKGRRERSGARG